MSRTSYREDMMSMAFLHLERQGASIEPPDIRVDNRFQNSRENKLDFSFFGRGPVNHLQKHTSRLIVEALRVRDSKVNNMDKSCSLEAIVTSDQIEKFQLTLRETVVPLHAPYDYD